MEGLSILKNAGRVGVHFLGALKNILVQIKEGNKKE
jgi:phage-related holin